MCVQDPHQVPLTPLAGTQGGEVGGELPLCAQAAVAVSHAEEQAGQLLVDRAARPLFQGLGQPQVHTECVGGTGGAGEVGEGEPLGVVGSGFGRGLSGGIEVLVVEEDVDEDRAPVPGLRVRFGVGTQHGESTLPFGRPVASGLGRTAQLLVGGRCGAGGEVVAAQLDGTGRLVGLGVSGAEVVDEVEASAGGVLSFGDAAFRLAQRFAPAADGIQLTGDGEMGAAVRGEVGRVHRDHRLHVPGPVRPRRGACRSDLRGRTDSRTVQRAPRAPPIPLPLRRLWIPGPSR